MLERLEETFRDDSVAPGSSFELDAIFKPIHLPGGGRPHALEDSDTHQHTCLCGV